MREPSVGDKIEGRYSLTRQIARGGSGVVYQAEHVITGRPVAIKIMHVQDVRDADKRERLLLEARSLVLARQPNVVEVLDAGLLGEAVPYVVMELLEGRTLAGLLASRGRLEIGNVVHVGRQLTFALAHVHDFGLIHRDVKPSNVLIARTEVGQEALKLIDFGIVRACDAEDDARRLTEDGAILGTPEYMAPEQLLGQDVDSRCDVYGAGVSLYECLTGVVPFEGTFGEILLKACTQQAPPIAEYRPEVPDALASVIEKAIAKEPDQRFATAREFYDEVTALAVQRWPRRPLLGLEDGQHTAGRAQGDLTEPSPVGKQRRRHARAPYLTPVRTTQRDGTHQDGRSEDISEAGLLVVLPQGLEDEERVRIRFALPVSGRIVTTTAKACWLRPSRAGMAVGLALALDDEDRATIGYYVSKMRRS